MKIIEVKTGRPYAIAVESGLLAQVATEIAAICGGKQPKLAVVTDDCVDTLYAGAMLDRLRAAGCAVCKFVFPAGESSKTLDTLQKLFGFFSENEITRSDLIIALGGGVTGDLAGFAAASWLRGVRLVQIPTSLLAMVDSSVGGKTAVDIPQGKNLVGAFWQPSRVICDPQALSTLAPEQFADGMAEVIKYGAILDETLFTLLEAGQMQSHIEEVICRCIELKRQVVETDELDHGVRQWLNFGHTFGHAIEKESCFTISHGRAVAIGMVMITKACESRGLTPVGTARRIADCCARYNLPTATEFSLEKLCLHCAGDKKRAGKTLSLVTLEALGKACLTPVPTDRLVDFMEGKDV